MSTQVRSRVAAGFSPTYSIISVGLAFLLSLVWISASSAQMEAAPITLVRAMGQDETGLSAPAGLAFSASANAFLAAEAPQQGGPAADQTDITTLTPFAVPAGSASIVARVRDPINMAFDGYANRLLIYKTPGDQLLDLREGPDGSPVPATMKRYNARGFGLQRPQGMAVDPTSGRLYILDAVGPRIVQVEPGPDGSFAGAVVSLVDLQPAKLADVRGLAFDPSTGNLHLISLADKRLYELTQAGQVVAFRDLAEFELGDPQGMVFAPSGDQTDDPSTMSLYLADRGAPAGINQGPQSPDRGQAGGGKAPVQASGQILELSLNAVSAPGPISFTSSLVRTTDLSRISPPSPDPDGLTYIPSRNTLLMSDSEVEETVNRITHFQGANVWELTLSGGVVRTANISKIQPTVVPMTNEPTGLAWNPSNGHTFVTDDGKNKVFDLNPGGDGRIGTADDSWTSFDTLGVGSGDPEGVAFDNVNNRLFVVDGVNREIYQFTLSGSLVSHFDVDRYGVIDPETVEFNPATGTLFVLSSKPKSPVVIETTLSGNLIQTINVSATNAKKPAGLAIAPASNGSGSRRFYIVDRGIDNNNDPNIVDGKMYEMTMP